MRPLNNTPMQWLLSQLAVVCVAMLLMMPSSCDAAGASVTLRARWQGTPYLLEAAEFLVREKEQQGVASSQATEALKGFVCPQGSTHIFELSESVCCRLMRGRASTGSSWTPSTCRA